MYGYSGSDFLIEPEHSHEMAEYFEGRYHVVRNIKQKKTTNTLGMLYKRRYQR